MKMSETTVRRGLYGMFAGGLLAFGSATIIAPVANAEPQPANTDNCTVSGIANTSSTVSASTSTYLASKPEANEALSEIATKPQVEAQAAYQLYFAENPQIESELQAINQPVVDLANQCGIEVTPTPISEVLSDL
jgi:heme-binding protein